MVCAVTGRLVGYSEAGRGSMFNSLAGQGVQM